MSEEIKALREELAKLRERVAVLEARPSAPNPHIEFKPDPFSQQMQPTWVHGAIGNPTRFALPTITCLAGISGDASLAAREAP